MPVEESSFLYRPTRVDAQHFVVANPHHVQRDVDVAHPYLCLFGFPEIKNHSLSAEQIDPVAEALLLLFCAVAGPRCTVAALLLLFSAGASTRKRASAPRPALWPGAHRRRAPDPRT